MSCGAPTSKIILTESFESIVEEIRSSFLECEIVWIDADDFLIEHAKEAVAKATLTSVKERIIVLSADRFTPIAQNKLLKILEEPPPKISFILMTPSKAGLLPTIRSRLPIESRLEAKESPLSGVDVERFDLSALYKLLQDNRRIDTKSAVRIVESLAKEAIRSGRYKMDEELLDSFEESIRLLDMGSPPSFVLNRVGLKLLRRRR